MKKACDIVVLGGGGGGMAAAVRAAELSGKKVIVLEKAEYIGGGAVQAADFRVYQSLWQHERGLDDAVETDLLKYMDMTYWKLDPKLVIRSFIATGQFFDWICGFEEGVADNFEPGRYIFDQPDEGPVVPTFKGLDSKPGVRSGGYIVGLLKKRAEELGVELLTKHRVVDVDVENGRIVSVTAESENGTVKIACDACILATGSWINNQPVLEKVHPKYAAIDPGPLTGGGHRNRSYTGDGIAIAERAGALIDYDSFCLRLMGPMVMSPCRTVSAMFNHPYAIQVNLEGRRWICEPSHVRMGIFDSGHVLCEQPEGVTFAVFDKNTLMKAAAQPPKEGFVSVFARTDFPEDVEADIEKELARKGGTAPGGFAVSELYSADTIEQLAEKIGVPAENLRETIEGYNRGCEAGVDFDFLKPSADMVPLTGPYYAVKGILGTDGAFGGVLVNPDMQAYKNGGGLAEGLYVVGDFASGRFVNDMGVKRQVINDLAWAYASGFIAAQSAADYLSV